MNKAFKTLLIIGIILITSGLLTAGTAIALGYAGVLPKFTETYEEAVFTTKESFENISIKSADMSVKIVASENNECKVVYSQPKDSKFDVKVENGTLTVDCRIDFYWFMNFISFGEKRPNITVYLPKYEYKDIEIENTSGNIDLVCDFETANLKCENVILKNVSGEIKLSNILADKAYLETVSGEVFVSNVMQKPEEIKLSGKILPAIGSAEIKTVSGKINLADGYIGGLTKITSTSGDIKVDSGMSFYNLDMRTTSGRLTLSDAVCTGDVVINTTSGEVNFENLGCNNFTAGTVSGAVKGSFSCGKLYDVTSTSGEVKLYDQDSSGGLCKVSTISGGIELSAIDA